MLYLANALAFAAIASFWSKAGWPNIIIAFVFTALAVLNTAGAFPFLIFWGVVK